MPEENNYKVIDVSYLRPPIGCWGAMYREMGIIPIFYQRAEELGIGHKNYVLPSHILCNQKTCDQLIDIIRESWEYYAIDRQTGEFKTRRLYVRHKHKKPLGKSDHAAIAYDCLNWSPCIRDDIPDGEIWLDLNIKPFR